MGFSVLFSSRQMRFVATFLMVLTIVFGTLGTPSRAHAVFGAGDVVIVAQDLMRDPKEFGLDAVAWSVAKMLVGDIILNLQSFTNQGFFGDPLIVSDPDAFFAKLSRDTTTAFMGEVSNSGIYEPIKRQLLKDLALSYTPYTERSRSTIQDVLTDPAAFSNDFSKGGWSGFLSLLEPQNNIYGQSYMAAQEQSRRIETATTNVKDELNQSGGLLSLPGKCLEYAGSIDTDNDGQATDNGDTDNDGQVEAGDTGSKCVRWERATPGQFITSTLSEALGSPLRSLENADEISEMLATLINNLVTSLLTEGITGENSSTGTKDIVSQDKQIITILTKEITNTTHLLSIRDSVVSSDTKATETITALDTLKASPQFIILFDGMPRLSEAEIAAYRAELTTIKGRFTTYTTSINKTKVTDAYASSLKTLLTDATAAKTTKTIVDAYNRYNTLFEPIDEYTRTGVFGIEETITKDTTRVTEIAIIVARASTVTP